MTERLYYEDSYLWEFDGDVTAVREDSGNWIALDRSAFYPTSGGQPFDTGTLAWNGQRAEVLDVEADKDGIVWHRVDRLIPVGTHVTGKIDGERRTDHMEQHGGEHMLAGAIWEKLGGVTIGLHLGKEESSIDVSMPDGRTAFTAEEIDLLENTVNKRIRMDAPIRCWFPSEEELGSLPLRKKPTVTEHVRIVAMGDFEMVACGGTHPASTGRIGQVRIVSTMPAKGKIRVFFVCGGRADRLFRTCLRSAQKAGRVLSCPPEKIASAAGALIAQLAEAQRKNNAYETDHILSQIRQQEETLPEQQVILSLTHMEECGSKAVTEAVSRYIAEDGRLLLLSCGERLTFARSRDVAPDMNELIRRVAKGGGRPDFASGAGIPECADTARKILLTEGKGRSWRTRN